MASPFSYLKRNRPSEHFCAKLSDRYAMHSEKGGSLRFGRSTLDDDSMLKVAVQLPADFAGDPERALRSFDREWWIGNCHRSRGSLVFDYEIQVAL